MSWFDPDAITKNVSNLAQKATKLAQETLLDDPLLVELEDLKKERDALKPKLSENNGLGSLENEQEIEKLLNANAQLQKDLADSQQKEQETSQMLAKIKTLAGDKIKRLTQQIQDLESQSEPKHDHSEHIIQDLQNQLEETLNSHQDQAKAFALEKQELKQIISTREKERDRFQQELIDSDARQQQELQTLKDALEEQRNLCYQLQNTQPSESVRQEYQEKDRITEALIAENERLEAELATYKNKLEENGPDMKRNDVASDTGNAEIEALKEKVSQLQETILVLEAESINFGDTADVESWKQKYSNLEKRYNSTCSELETTKEDTNRLTEEHKITVAGLERQITELSTSHRNMEVLPDPTILDKLRSSINEKSSLIASLQDQVVDLENVQAQLENTLELSKQKYKSAIQEAAQVPALQQRISQYLAQIKTLQEELNSVATVDHGDLNSKIDYLTGELESARSEIAFLRSSGGESLELALAEQQTQISVYQMEVQTLSQQISQYQAQITSLQEELNAATAQDHNELLARVEQLTVELEIARQEIAFLQSSGGDSNELVLAEQQTQISVYQMEIQSLSEQLASAIERNQDHESLVTELEGSKREIISLSEKIEQVTSDAQKKILEYESQIAKLSEMLEHSQQSVPGQSDSDGKVEQLNTQLDALKVELENAHQEISQLHSMAAGGNVQGVELTETVQLLRQQVEEYQNQCQALENSCVEFQSIVESLSAENQALDQERTLLSEKLDTFKQTVGTKIQEEMEESKRLKNLLDQSNQENENLMAQVQELSSHLANAQGHGDTQQEMEYLQKKTVELAAQVQKSEAELTRLRSYLVEVEETSTNEAISMQNTIEEYQKQIAVLEKEREDWASVNEQEQELRESDMSLLAETKQKLSEMVQERSSLQSKIDQDAVTIKNLQNVLSQFEKEKEQDIQDAILVLKKALAKAEAEAKEFKEKCNSSMKRLSELEKNAKMVGPLEKELNDKTLQVGQLRHDIVQLQSHLNEAMRIMKQGSSEDSVDRKLVANLIVGFMVAKHGDKKRFEILSLMSSILQLSEEEKAKVGLIRQPGSQISPRPSQAAGQSSGENFMDMWINFLNNETSSERRNSTARSGDLNPQPGPLPSPQAPAEPQSPAPAPRSWFG